MVKLVKLLFELSAAAAEAEKKGLDSMSFGRYGKDGKVTHMARGDKLVPVKDDEVGDDKPSAQNPDMKPTGMSAKDAGKAPSNAVTAKDVAKTTGAESPAPDTEKEFNKLDKEHDLSSQQDEPEHRATPNPFHTEIRAIGKTVTPEELRRYVPEKLDPYGFGETVHLEEELEVCTSEQFERFLYAETGWDGLPEWRDEQLKKDLQAAEIQGSEWRVALDDEVQRELLHVQAWWQEMPQFKRPSSDRTSTNAFINNICKGPPPATLEIDHPLERGMMLAKDELPEFLKAFRVGEELEVPPSGFSLDPRQARSFGEPGYMRAGVVVRLAPNRDGQVHGLALCGYKPSPDLFEDPDDQRYAERLGDEYRDEAEVIRPSGPKAMVKRVRKIMEQPRMQDVGTYAPTRCLYIIEMEEMGYPVDAEQVTESVDETPVNKAFIEKMNSPLRQKERNEASLMAILNQLGMS